MQKRQFQGRCTQGGSPGRWWECTRPDAGGAGSLRGMPVKAGAFRPPLFFARAKKSRRRSGGKETRLAPFAPQRADRGSPQSAEWKLSASAGCGGHCADLILLRRKLGFGRSSGCRIERPLRFGLGRSAPLRPTGVVDGGTPFRFPTRLPGYARSEAERAGRGGQTLRFSTPTTTALLRHAVESFRQAPVYSAAGRRLPGLVGSV